MVTSPLFPLQVRPVTAVQLDHASRRVTRAQAGSWGGSAHPALPKEVPSGMHRGIPVGCVAGDRSHPLLNPCLFGVVLLRRRKEEAGTCLNKK